MNCTDVTTCGASTAGRSPRLSITYRRLVMAEENRASATNAGDAKSMAQAVRALSKETVHLETLNGHKFNLEQAKKAPPPHVRGPSGNAIDDNDPRLQSFSPTIKEWIKRNPR